MCCAGAVCALPTALWQHCIAYICAGALVSIAMYVRMLDQRVSLRMLVQEMAARLAYHMVAWRATE